MSNAAHDALIHLMIVAASSDSAMTEKELVRIQALIGRLPVFEGFDKSREIGRDSSRWATRFAGGRG